MTTTETDAPAPDTPTNRPMIYAAMAAVMKDVAPVGKNNQNSEQKYKFRSIEDVMNAVKAGLTKHDVFYLPTVLSRIPEERRTAGGKPMNVVHLEIRYDFYAADGSSVSSVVWGEGADLADKATNKAMSAALKYNLVQAFSIAAEDIEDSDRSAEEAGSYRSAGAAFDNALSPEDYRIASQQGQGRAQQRNGNGAQSNGNGRNGHQAQRPAAPALQPLADDDPWKDRISDLATPEEARSAWEEIAAEVKAGTMAEVRGGLLQKHIRAHMALRAQQDGNPAANGNGHQPAADPVTTGQHDPWADQPNTDPWSAEDDQPADPPTADGDNDWIFKFRADVELAPNVDELNTLRRSIGKAIADKHITAKQAPELSNLVQERVKALAGGAR